MTRPLGYEVLAFESSLYQCHDADLVAGEASPMKTLTGCAYGVWHTEGVLPLFEYLRESRAQKAQKAQKGTDLIY